MKKALAVVLCLWAGAALAQGASTAVTKTFRQNLTGTAPTSATDGVDISGAAGFVVIVSADLAATLTGGSLLCYYYGAVNVSGTQPTFRWMRCPTSLDFTPGTGVRDAPSGDYETPAGFGKIKYMPSAITVSGGTQVDVTITVRKR
jgi:hypothetical protein